MMFGLGKNRKFLDEFSELLADMGNIDQSSSVAFTKEYKGWILQSKKRGLDAFGALWHIVSQSMERIDAAHQVNMLEEVRVVPDFMFLAGIKIAKAMEAEANVDNANLNRYFFHVLELPVDPDKPEKTYSDMLQSLIEQEKRGKIQTWRPD